MEAKKPGAEKDDGKPEPLIPPAATEVTSVGDGATPTNIPPAAASGATQTTPPPTPTGALSTTLALVAPDATPDQFARHDPRQVPATGGTTPPAAPTPTVAAPTAGSPLQTMMQRASQLLHPGGTSAPVPVGEGIAEGTSPMTVAPSTGAGDDLLRLPSAPPQTEKAPMGRYLRFVGGPKQ